MLSVGKRDNKTILLLWVEYRTIQNAEEIKNNIEILNKNAPKPFDSMKYSYPDYTFAVCCFDSFKDAEDYRMCIQKYLGRYFDRLCWKTIPFTEENDFRKTDIRLNQNFI